MGEGFLQPQSQSRFNFMILPSAAQRGNWFFYGTVKQANAIFFGPAVCPGHLGLPSEWVPPHFAMAFSSSFSEVCR